MNLHEFRCYFRDVGRATVPAKTGRHGGRPYDNTGPEFPSRLHHTGRFFGQRLRSCETILNANRRILNKKYRMMKCGIASL